MNISINHLSLRPRSTKTPADHEHFDYEISLENPVENPLVGELLDALGIAPNTKDSEHLGVVLANLGRDLSLGGSYTAVSMTESKIPRCVNGFGLRRARIKCLVLGLRDANLIEFHIGSRDKETGRRLRTKIRATPKLICLFQSRSPVNIHLVRPANREPLRLRGKRLEGETKGDFIEYKDMAHTRRMRNRLVRYNQILSQARIELDPAASDSSVRRFIDLEQTFTYRVFSEGRWNRGVAFHEDGTPVFHEHSPRGRERARCPDVVQPTLFASRLSSPCFAQPALA